MSEPTLRDEQRELTRRRLVEAACAVFVEKGYGATSIIDIVRAARTSRATFYLHFPNKEAVFGAAVEASTSGTSPYRDGLGAVLRSGARADLRRWLAAALRWWDEHADVQRVLQESLAGDPRIGAAHMDTLAELVSGLSDDDLTRFRAGDRPLVRRKVLALILQLGAAWSGMFGGGVDSDREQLLDALTDVWCAVLRRHGDIGH